MARSPADATRFTATGPYASSSPSFTSNAPGFGAGSQLNIGSAPPNETAQQKIARLRAAAAAAKRGNESKFDAAVRVGRLWADRAHRVTAVGLIGLTVVSGTVAAYGITDMLLHNRRRRNEWLAEKQAETARLLAEARRDAEMGKQLDDDQILLINQERAAAEAEAARKNRPGVAKRTADWLFGGMAKEEQKGGRWGVAVAAGEGAKEEVLGQQHDRSLVQRVGDGVEGSRKQGEKVAEIVNPLGGPLDRQAVRASAAVAGASKSWTAWLTGR
jgi:hypothetical protein